MFASTLQFSMFLHYYDMKQKPSVQEYGLEQSTVRMFQKFNTVVTHAEVVNQTEITSRSRCENVREVKGLTELNLMDNSNVEMLPGYVMMDNPMENGRKDQKETPKHLRGEAALSGEMSKIPTRRI